METSTATLLISDLARRNLDGGVYSAVSGKPHGWGCGWGMIGNLLMRKTMALMCGSDPTVMGYDGV